MLKVDCFGGVDLGAGQKVEAGSRDMSNDCNSNDSRTEEVSHVDGVLLMKTTDLLCIDMCKICKRGLDTATTALEKPCAQHALQRESTKCQNPWQNTPIPILSFIISRWHISTDPTPAYVNSCVKDRFNFFPRVSKHSFPNPYSYSLSHLV